MTETNKGGSWQEVPQGGQSNAPKHEEDWTDKTWKEIKDAFNQIDKALREAYDKNKDNPRLKKLGQDVKTSFSEIGEDIADLFDGEQKPKA